MAESLSDGIPMETTRVFRHLAVVLLIFAGVFFLACFPGLAQELTLADPDTGALQEEGADTEDAAEGTSDAMPATSSETNATEDEKGLDLLDKAMQTKVTAQKMSDLDLVVSQCREALELGLSPANEAFARELITATLYEKANRLVATSLEGDLEPNFGQRRAAAKKALLDAVEFDPSHGESHLLLARLEALPGGDTEAGRTAVDRAIELLASNPARQSAAYLARADYQESEEERLGDLNRAVELDSQNAQAWRARGRAQLLGGDAEKALADFRYLLEKDPQDLESLYEISRALAVQEKYDEALEFVQKLVDAAPKLSDAHVLRANILLMQEKMDDALEALNQAIELEPSNPSHLLTRSNLLRVMERFPEALADIDQVLQDRPGLIPAVTAKADLLIALDKFGDAAELLKGLLQNAPGPELRLQIAALYLAAERPSQASEMYAELIEGPSPPWEAYRGRGDALLAMGKHAEAIADYEIAMKLKPKDAGILNNLAWVLATSTFDDLRNGARAIEIAQQACELTEFKQAHILSTLAAGYAESGKFAEAIEWSEKAVALGEGPVKEQLAAELDSYKQGKPWREHNEAEEPSSETPVEADAASLDDLKIDHDPNYIDHPNIPSDP